MLWRRVNRGLSAGRVQSPSIRLIVERERERIAFISADYWDIDLLTATSPAFDAKLVAVDGDKVASGKDFDDRGVSHREGRRPRRGTRTGLADGLETPRSRSAPSRRSRTGRRRSRRS